jgi:hypothetical protein
MTLIKASVCAVLALGVSACREVCGSDELRYGDECRKKPDSGSAEGDSGEEHGAWYDTDGGGHAPDDAESEEVTDAASDSAMPSDADAERAEAAVDSEADAKPDCLPRANAVEICGDDKDNDCDGLIDEPDAIDATLWYQDCDGDGYAASLSGAVESCVQPKLNGHCTWTTVIPQPETKTNWDCDDSNPAYAPGVDYGFPPAGSTSSISIVMVMPSRIQRHPRMFAARFRTSFVRRRSTAAAIFGRTRQANTSSILNRRVRTRRFDSTTILSRRNAS